MAGIPNNELVAQLNAFMRSVIAQWVREQLVALGSEMHVECRGPDNNPITFDLYLLENEVAGRLSRYLNVAVSAYDFREGDGLVVRSRRCATTSSTTRMALSTPARLLKLAYGWQDA